MFKKIAWVTVAALLVVQGARAEVIGGSATNGFAILTTPLGSFTTPANTVNNNNVNRELLYAFNEKQDVLLGSALSVDSLNGGGAGTIPAGTWVSSHYVFYDPVNNTIDGKVQFDSNVIGIITSDALLISSNSLGDPFTNYNNVAATGLEPGDTAVRDGTLFSQVDVHLSASNPGDWLRVITVGTPLPASFWGGVVLLGVVAGAKLIARRQGLQAV